MRINLQQVKWLGAAPSGFRTARFLENFLPFRKYAWLDQIPSDLPPEGVLVVVSTDTVHILDPVSLEEVWRSPASVRSLDLDGRPLGEVLFAQEHFLEPASTTPAYIDVVTEKFTQNLVPIPIEASSTCLRVGPSVFDFQTGDWVTLTIPDPNGGSEFIITRGADVTILPREDSGVSSAEIPSLVFTYDEVHETLWNPVTGSRVQKNLRDPEPAWSLAPQTPPVAYFRGLPGGFEVAALRDLSACGRFGLFYGLRESPTDVATMFFLIHFAEDLHAEIPDDVMDRALPLVQMDTLTYPTLQEDDQHIYLHTHLEILRVTKSTRAPEILNYVYGTVPTLDAPPQGTLPVGRIQSLVVSGPYLVATFNQSQQPLVDNSNPAYVTVAMDKLAKSALWYRSSSDRSWGEQDQTLPIGTVVNPGVSPVPRPGEGP